MANILLLDPGDVAQRAMQGILTRGHHRCALATTLDEAWDLVRELVKVDLLFTEVKVRDESGLHLIRRLRHDCFLRHLPIVVYTSVAHHDNVAKALALKVQNFLVKPYADAAVYGEIAKAEANPWRDQHFEEERSFCAQMGLSPADLRRLRQSLTTAITETQGFFLGCAESQNYEAVPERITTLSESAEGAGVWGVVDYLKELHARTGSGDWAALKSCQADLDYAKRLIFVHLNPSHVPPGFISDQERQEQQEAKERARWLDADLDRPGPLVSPSEVEQQLDKLAGCPVIDTVGAMFLMTLSGQASSLDPVMDLVDKDPGLTAQVLIAANGLERDEMTPIEDPRAAIGLLGHIRLVALARTLLTVPERHMQAPPITWPRFWMFQVGVARLAHFTCNYLGFRQLVSVTRIAGLLHDLGKLLLLRLYPFGFQAIVRYSKTRSVPWRDAEMRYLGCTSRGMGERFARRKGLPAVFCDVIRWVETPEAATENQTAVAVVALARHLCLHNHVGYCGDMPKDYCPPIEETAAWAVLRGQVFPSFDLGTFRAKVHTHCAELKQELSGR